VIPGQIVIVDWRDAIIATREPNKLRPGIVVGAESFFDGQLRFNVVVPLTGDVTLAIAGASTRIDPAPENGCVKPSYALAWCVQTVPHVRITTTDSHIESHLLRAIRRQIAACVDAL
jgi:mRNA-degrading endonuclease toxin of MazEF toxin-antitoxin module